MLIEQINEFKLSGPGPSGRKCTTGYFYDKTKISKENLQVDYNLLLKYCTRQCILLSSTLAKSLTKVNPKYKILNVFWA